MFGLSEPWLLHNGAFIPTVVGLSLEEQVDRLRESCPEAVPAARVLGDPCIDRLQACKPLRETYRQAFGLLPGQHLILLTSTWGPDSLYGRRPDLALELARRLPLDDYRIAMCLHPNVAAGHSPWQVRMWLEECRRDGVLILSDGDQWMPATLAASLVVGDHGSICFYAASQGIPVLLASAPTAAVDPASPVGALLRTAPRVDPGDDLPELIEKMITTHDPATYSAITALGTSHPGEFVQRFRATVYELLGLSVPSTVTGDRPVPKPEVAFTDPQAAFVHATVRSNHKPDIELARYPSGSLLQPAAAPEGAWLVVDASKPRTEYLRLADVIVHHDVADAAAWTRATLGDLPGCRLVAARDRNGWLFASADGEDTRSDTATTEGTMLAPALLAWMAAGRKLTDLPRAVTIRSGAREITATVEPTAP